VAAVLVASSLAGASVWQQPAQQLAQKIVAVTGQTAVTVSFEDHSRHSGTDLDDLRRELLDALRAAGARPVEPAAAATAIKVSLSENPRGPLLIAEIGRPSGDPAVAIVEVIHTDAATTVPRSSTLELRKAFLFSTADPTLDVLPFATPSGPRLAVLQPENVTIFVNQNGAWKPEQSAEVVHGHPFPRDIRGRLAAGAGHWFDVFLPGTSCVSNNALPVVLTCHDADDSWPLTATGQRAFFSSARNFFTGVLVPEAASAGPFYSAADVPGASLVFSGVNGSVRAQDTGHDRAIAAQWGSDVAALKSPCSTTGLLATGDGDYATDDSITAFDVSSGEPVAISDPAAFSGPVTALWVSPDQTSAIAVSHNIQTGRYEAYRISAACSQ
jgi:hypothetical protein